MFPSSTLPPDQLLSALTRAANGTRVKDTRGNIVTGRRLMALRLASTARLVVPGKSADDCRKGRRLVKAEKRREEKRAAKRVAAKRVALPVSDVHVSPPGPMSRAGKMCKRHPKGTIRASHSVEVDLSELAPHEADPDHPHWADR